MPPVALPNLYCQPSDIFDLLGTSGTQLRLDDHSLATAQRVRVTVNAAAGATSLSVLPLRRPLLPGTVLEFDGAGMPAVVEIALTALGKVGDTTLSIGPTASNPAPAAIPALAEAFDSGVNLALAQRLIKGCQYGTSQVKLYCCSRYDDSALATCWSANRWATALGARWVCRRRGQAAPQSIEDAADESLEEMKQVRVGMLNLEDVPTRTSGWPFLSNIFVDVGYDVCRLRVEQQISELTPTQYSQRVDWNSVWCIEW